MALGKSLLDDDKGSSSIGTHKASAAAKGGQSTKLILAVALFLIAGAVLAYTSGIFAGAEKPKETITVEQQQAHEVQKQRTEETVKNKKGQTGGTD